MNPTPRGKAPLFILAAVALLSLTALHLRHHVMTSTDDAFITYRYAQNLALGNGLRFNVDERYYGSTATGLAILLGGMAKAIDASTRSALTVRGWEQAPLAIIILLGSLLSAFSIALTTVLIAAVHLKNNRPVLAIALAGPLLLLFSFSGASSRVAGQETNLYLCLLVLALYLLYFRSAPVAAGLTIAVACTVRPDCLLMALILSGLAGLRYIVAKPERRQIEQRQLVRFSSTWIPLLLSWLTFCYVYYGHPLPGTFVAKHAQRSLGYWGRFSLPRALADSAHSFGTPALAVLAGLFALSFTLSIWRFRRHLSNLIYQPALLSSLAIFLFTVGQALFYTLSDITYWPWYWVQFLLGLVIAFVIAPSILVDHLNEVLRPTLFRTSYVLLLVVAIFATYSGRAQIQRSLTTRRINQHIGSYSGVATYLRQHEPGGTTIAISEPGALAFELGPRFRVIDTLGLTSPGVAQAIQKNDIAFPFCRWHPDYFVLSWAGRYTPHRKAWFPRAYRLAGEFHHPYWDRNLHRGVYLYHLFDVSALPCAASPQQQTTSAPPQVPLPLGRR